MWISLTPCQINEPLSSLKEFGLEQLYPSAPASPVNGIQSDWTLDRAFYLKKITRSILLNFLELVGVLSVSPEQFQEKLDDLKILFANAHHLINEYRPHQARETLILMMEDQLDRAKGEVEGIKIMKQKINNVMEGLGKAPVDSLGTTAIEQLRPLSPDNKRKEKQRQIWRTIYEDEELNS